MVRRQRLDKEKASRPNSTQRGYNRAWESARKYFLRVNPLCVRCLKEKKKTPATVVDHVIPHKGDKSLFWDQENWQALCKKCHDKKTMTEDGGYSRSSDENKKPGVNFLF